MTRNNQMLKKYISQDPASLNLKKDENAYIKHIDLENKKALDKEEKEKKKRDQENIK